MVIIRISSFLILSILAVFGAPWIVLPLALIYAFTWRAYELLFLAACIDAYFGGAAAIPYYTTTTLLFIVVAEWVKPYLSIYNK